MPDKTYGTILTRAGNAGITNAMLTGEQVKWAKICVGDGNGYDYIPDSNQTSLRNQLWSGPITEMTLAEGNENQIIIHGVIPSDVGGFWIREIGILDEDDNLVAVGNTPAQEKATGANKVIMDMDLYIHVLVSNAEVVNVIVDPTVTIASQADLRNLEERVQQLISQITQVDVITDPEIDEITQTPVAGNIIIGEGLSDDEVTRLIDDDPYNDPTDFVSTGALSDKEIQKILQGE